MLITVDNFFIVYNGFNGHTYACKLGDTKCPFEFTGEIIAKTLTLAKVSHDTGIAEVRRGLRSQLVGIGSDVFALVELDSEVFASYLGDWNEAPGVIPTLDYPEEVVSELFQLVARDQFLNGHVDIT